MPLTLDDAKAAKDEAQSGNLRDNDAGISEEFGIDYEEHAPIEVGLDPNVLVTFDHIARIAINTYGHDVDLLDERQNLERAGPQNYGFDVELTLADPEIIEGELWVDDPDAEYPEYRVLGDPEAADNPYELRETVIRDDDGNVQGAETEGIGSLPGGNSWDAIRVDEGFPTDYIEVSIGSNRAASVLGVLDTAGMWFETSDGDIAEGLFEAPPGFWSEAYDHEDGDAIRLVGYPELRADMDGQRGAITAMFDTDDGEATTRTRIDVDVHKIVTDEDGTETLEALTPLTPDDEAYAKPTYPRAGNLFWDHDTDGDVGADAEPETTNGVAEAQAMMNDTDGTSAGGTSAARTKNGSSDDDVTYEALSSAGQEFVDEAVEMFQTAGYDEVADYDADPDTATFEERFATVSSDGEIVASQGDVKAIINDRL